MDLKTLQTSSGKFTIAAFDQRASLAKLLGVDPQEESGKSLLIEFKNVFMETFSPICSAVLVDPEFGLPSLEKKSASSGLLMSLEKAAYTIDDKEAVPELNPEWMVEDVAKHNAAVKFVLYYNPESKNAQKKRELVKQIYESSKQAGVPFLFEVILHNLETQTEKELADHHPALQLQTVTDFTGMCDVLKLEFPLLPNEVLDETLAAQACKKISETATVPWIILSKGMGYERFIVALNIEMQNGASGFAVGRAVWKEIGDLADSQQQLQFIRTTAKERMNQLIQIVEKTS